MADVAKLDQFKPLKKNPNPHTLRGLKALDDSIRQDGYTEPMVAAANRSMLSGNARLDRVADVFGLDVEPIIVESDGTRPVIHIRTDIPDEEAEIARRIIVRSNRVAQLDIDWDVEALVSIAPDDLLTSLWNPDELSDLGAEWGNGAQADDPGPQIDRAAELQEHWQTASGQLWALGEHRLICGDCTDAETVARVMDGENAALCVTSPPYPGADMWDDIGAVAEVERVGLNALRTVTSFVSNGCPILWNVANTPIGTQAGVVHTTTTTTTKLASEELGLLCYGEIIWAKPCQHLTPLAFMMRPVVPNLIHEYVMIFYKGKRKQRESSSGLSDEDKAIRTKSVWELNTESAEDVGHKAPFPLELARRCVALWSLEGDTVLEPFAGSGTTLIACERLGRKCRAVEISPAYVAVALQRWADMTGKTPELISA